MTDRRPERIEALRRLISEADLDALCVSSLPNIRYLTGFTGSSALLLVTTGTVMLLSDFRYREQAGSEVGDLARLSFESGGAWERLVKELSAASVPTRAGFEAHIVPAREAALLAEAPKPLRFVPTTDMVERLRQVKAPEEVTAMRQAGLVATRALSETVASVRAGQTEREVAATLEAALRRGGSEWHPFQTIVASGPHSALPHARTAERTVAPGDLLLVDFGAMVDGYCADVTRTFVVGRDPDARQREVFDLVAAARGAAVGSLRSGLTGRQADALARDVIEAGGMGDAFGHSLGHGIGLEVHEAPRLAKTAEDTLPAAAVVTVEPGVYLGGWGGIRIEDDVLLGPAASEVLTDFPRELMRLG